MTDSVLIIALHLKASAVLCSINDRLCAHNCTACEDFTEVSQKLVPIDNTLFLEIYYHQLFTHMLAWTGAIPYAGMDWCYTVCWHGRVLYRMLAWRVALSKLLTREGGGG